MNLRTTFAVDPSPVRITHSDRVVFIGSCFASSIGARMERGKIPVLVNPSGSVYNPFSVGKTIEQIISEKIFTNKDLHCHNGTWLSFSHYTDFSSDDQSVALRKINDKIREASQFFKSATVLFITFGTARIYRFRSTGQIVSNCHKIPAEQFDHELISVSAITELWNNLLDRLAVEFPELKVVFTISPVRHLKDGAHGNQVSKSVLFLAVEELLQHPSKPQYFPAYEIVMDDLRDYRFYDDDMLHPSSSAIEYIWERFSGCWFTPSTTKLCEEISRVVNGMNHRFNTDNKKGRILFAENMLNQIIRLENQIPDIDFSAEKKYFDKIILNP